MRESDHGHDLLGATVVLKRSSSSVARLYSLAVRRSARGRGVAQRLLEAAQRDAGEAGAAVLRLETRADNHVAQRLFVRSGFLALDRQTAYYHDGADALRFQKPLWNASHAANGAASHAPFYAQTLEFTCGPCALLMAMAALDHQTVLDRTAEIRLWREATTVFMAAGHGGCGPFGLALAAVRRGFHATVHASSGQAMFTDTVRDARKKEVIALVEADFHAQLACTGATLVASPLTTQRLLEHLESGGVPLVLISLWRLHGEKGPHWVVVTGFDGHVLRILDPIASSMGGGTGTSLTLDEFKRITRFGRRRQAAAVILSNPIEKA